MELLLKDIQGKDVDKIDFLGKFDSMKVNSALIHESIVNYLANQRQGNSSTKTRAEVSGGGKKPWKQKGTGRARAGSNRSPLWRHGGIIFGPKPRNYSYSIPEKKRQKALLNALIMKVQENKIVGVDAFLNKKIEKTKQFVNILKNLNLETGKALIVLKGKEEKLVRATRNIENVSLVYASNINIYDIMNNDNLILDKDSICFLNEKFGEGK